MSWLLIAATPALLMLVTVGLERIETGLSRNGAAEATAPARRNPQFRAPSPTNHV